MSVEHNKLYRWTESKTEEMNKTEEPLENNLIRNDSYAEGMKEEDNTEIVEDAREEVAKNMPPTVKDLVSFKNKIENVNYEYADGNTFKNAKRTTKATGYMRDILTTLRSLETLLDKPFSTEEKDVEAVQSAFLAVVQACEIYIDKRTGFFAGPWSAEGKARKQMVQDLYEQIKEESVRFSDHVRTLREKKADNGGDEENEIKEENKNWFSVLGDMRTEKYVHNEGGVEITKGGEGTSDIYIINDNGKKMFFKESEKVPPYSVSTLLGKELDRLDTLQNKPELSQGEQDRHHRRHDVLHKIIDKLKGFDSDRNVADTITSFRDRTQVYNWVRDVCYGASNQDNPLENAKRGYEQHINRKMQETRKLEAYKRNYETADKVARERIQQQINDSENYIAELTVLIENSDYLYYKNLFIDLHKNLTLSHIATNDAKIDKNEDISKRNVATSRLAKMLGLEDIVAESCMAEIMINGEKKRGIRMSEAKGDPFADIYNNLINEPLKQGQPIPQISYVPNAVRQLLCLQVFDLICGQVDRSYNNYLSEMQEYETGKYEVMKITAIDNDLGFGLVTYKDITSKGKQPYRFIPNIEENGEMKLPAMDKVLKEKILNLTPEMINFQLGDVLSKEERKALIDRIQGVQKAIRKKERALQKQNKNPNSFFLDPNKLDWVHFTNRFMKECANRPNKQYTKLQPNTYFVNGILEYKGVDYGTGRI